MAIIVRLAWRNIWRHPRRSGLTLGAIAFAAFLLVFMITLQLGSYDMMIDGNLRLLTGHFQVQRQGYLDKPQMRATLERPRELAAALRQVPGVAAAAARANGFALVSSASRSYGAQVVGVEAAYESALSNIPKRIREGRFLGADDAQEAVVGSTLARNLKLAVGDEITLLGSGRDGSIAAAVLPVVGIFDSGSADLDRGLIEIPLGAFQEIFSMGDSAHLVAGVADSLERLPHILPLVRAALPRAAQPLAVLDWDALVPGLQQLVEGDMVTSWFMYLCLIIIVTFSVLNTFLMAVLERTREFGVMLALGVKPLRIGALVMLESLFLTLLGLALGSAAGGGVAWYYHLTGFSYPGMAEFAAEFGMPSEIYPQLSPLAFSLGPLAILLFTLLAALYPALRIRHLQPVEAMKAL